MVQFIEPTSFALVHSLRILLMVVVGGSATSSARCSARRIVVLLPEFLRFTDGYYLILYAAFVIVLMVCLPGGLIGLGRARRRLPAAERLARRPRGGAQL